MVADRSSDGDATGAAPGFLASRTDSGRGTVHTPLADDGVFGLSDLPDDVEAGDGVDVYYRGSDPSAGDVVAVRPRGAPGVDGVDPPSPPKYARDQRVGLGVVGRQNGTPTVRTDLLPVRPLVVSDGLVPGEATDLDVGDVVWVIADEDPSGADDVVGVVPVEAASGGADGSGGEEGSDRPRDGRDLRTSLTLDPSEASAGVTKRLQFRRPTRCSTCGGDGHPPGAEPRTCPECDGQGEVGETQETPLGRVRQSRTCERCGGEGELVSEGCSTCDGDGVVEEATALSVDVPSGVEDGQTLRMAGEGAPGRDGGADGDLLVDVSVREPDADELAADEGIVETAVRDSRSADGDVRARIVTPLAEDRALSLSGLDAELSEGDRVRLRYSGSDPGADDIVGVERIGFAGDADATGDDAGSEPTSADAAADEGSTESENLATDEGFVETAVRDTASADGDVRARIVTPLAGGRALSLSGLDAELSEGDRVRLRYSGSDPSAEDVVGVERIEAGSAADPDGDGGGSDGGDAAADGDAADDPAGEPTPPLPDPVVVETDGVTVEKALVRGEFPVPAVAFEIASERSEPATLTLVDEAPGPVSGEDVGFHPDYGAEDWSARSDGQMTFRRELAPGETVRTVYGLRAGADGVDALDPPLLVTADPVDPAEGGGAVDDAGDGDEDGKPLPDPARPWPEPTVPERLALSFDDWETGELLGTGGNAEVYEASVAGEDRTIAVKAPRLAAGESMSRGDQSEFLAEAELWHRVDDHPHVARLLDSGAEPFPWIAMELLSGGTLDERAPLSTPAALGVADAVIDAVAHAHDLGVTHGDLKPANVLFTAAGEAGVPKVADWGLARALLEEGESSVGDITPQYAAPEQLDGETLTPRERKLSDVYAVGAVAYEALTGRPPFEGSTYEVLDAIRTAAPPAPSDVADVPPAVDGPLLGALAKDPGERPPTVFHLRESLLGD